MNLKEGLVGIIDVGGGMRGAYSAGIYDFLLEQQIEFDYCLGISAGSANLITYLARQKGRTIKFYTEYSFRKEYMGIFNFIKSGSYLDLNYIYSTLSNSDGENPIDYAAFVKSEARFVVAVTDALSGNPHYFKNSDIHENEYDVIKASCAMPLVCKPYKVNGRFYFDGGISEPIPYQKAFSDGCERLVVILTRPRDFVRPPQNHTVLFRRALKQYPETFRALNERHFRYNKAVRILKEYEKNGRVLIIAPSDITGMKTLTKDKAVIERLYQYGYEDGRKVADFYNGLT